MLQLPDLHAETKAVPKKAIMSWETAQEYLNPPAYTSNKPWEGSYVYWGNDSGTPMKWQILNTNETSFGDNSMLLFSTGTVGATEFNSSTYGNYNDSKLAILIDGKMDSSLTTAEKENTIESGINSGEYNVSGNSYNYIDNFSGKKWFAPTAMMMSTVAYGFPNSNAGDESRNGNYWLSSANTEYSNHAGFVLYNGMVHSDSTYFSKSAKVATNVSSQSLLFVSNAVGGKTEGSLASVNASDSNEYKLTLKDTSQTKPIVTEINTIGDTVTFKYDNVTVGTNQKLSAVVTSEDGNEIISYGVVADASVDASGTASITLPMTLAEFDRKNYKLKVYSEQANGDYKTDLASELVDISLSRVVTIKYKDISGIDQTKNITVSLGSDLTENQEFKDILAIVPTGYRKADTFWMFSEANMSVDDLENITKSFTATMNWIKTYDISCKYRENDKDFTEKTVTVTVDEGTNLMTSNNLPTLPDDYSEHSGVKYRFKEIGTNKWTAASGSLTNVTHDMSLEAKTIKQLKTVIKYRNESKPTDYISNDYWIDTGGAVTGNILGTSTPYLPELKTQIKGYRLKEQEHPEIKENVWKSSDAANTLENIIKPSTIEPEYVKNWEVDFKTWDNKELQGVIYVDDNTGLTADQIPTPPERSLYSFTGWSEDITNITKNTTVKPIYTVKSIYKEKPIYKETTIDTGDHSMISLYVGGVTVSLLLGFIISRRKKNQRM